MISRFDDDTGVTISYSWDSFNKLVAVSSADSGGPTNDAKQENSYLANGFRRKKKAKSGAVTTEYSAGLSTAMARVGSDPISYIQGHHILGFEKGGSYYWYLTDHLGSVRDIVSGTDGTVLQSYDYRENGEKTASTSLQSDKTWVGGLSVNDDTADSGLYLMGHRHFDATLGRFLSRDPIGFAGGLNLYSYAGNSPVSNVDPVGLRWLTRGGFGGSDGSGYGMDPGPAGPYRYWEFTPEPAPVLVEEDPTEWILDPNLVKSLTGMAKRWGLPVGGVIGVVTVAGAYSMVGGGGRGFGRRGGQRGFANFRKPCNEPGTNRNPNKLGPLPDAIGEHSTFRRGPDGVVTNYEVYDFNPVTGLFGAQKRFRGVGKPHDGVDPPFVLERAPGKGPGSAPSTVRAPEPWELPGGY